MWQECIDRTIQNIMVTGDLGHLALLNAVLTPENNRIFKKWRLVVT
jgi:hypothetical protein